MNTRLLLTAAGATGLVLVIIGLTWSLHHPATHGHASPRNRTAHPAATTTPSQAATSQPRLSAAEASRLLPFSPDQIAEAADLASRFTAAYNTYRYDETPAQYIQRLTPMMSPALTPVITLAADDPTTLAQRHRTQEISIGQAHPEQIRDLGPSSITFLLTATDYITTTYTARHDTTRYAVTLTQTTGSWLVYAIDLAAVGDSGDGGTP